MSIFFIKCPSKCLYFIGAGTLESNKSFAILVLELTTKMEFVFKQSFFLSSSGQQQQQKYFNFLALFGLTFQASKRGLLPFLKSYLWQYYLLEN